MLNPSSFRPVTLGLQWPFTLYCLFSNHVGVTKLLDFKRPAWSKIEGRRNIKSIEIYWSEQRWVVLRPHVSQRTNPQYIPTESFIVGVHVPPSSLGEGGPPLDPPISHHLFVFSAKQQLTPTHIPHFSRKHTKKSHLTIDYILIC